jgi:hypothetical protein
MIADIRQLPILWKENKDWEIRSALNLMPLADIEIKSRVAYHESAHAVAAHVQGIPVCEISIVPSEVYKGYCATWSDRSTAHKRFAIAVTHLAGMATEYRRWGGWMCDFSDFTADRIEAIRILRGIFEARVRNERVESFRYYEPPEYYKAWRVACNIVRTYEYAIDILTRELFKQKILNESTCQEILQTVIQQKGKETNSGTNP